MMDSCILNAMIARATNGGGQRTNSVPLNSLEPTPIDPNRIVTVPKVPFDSSPLGRIADETVLAALCDVFKSHRHHEEESFRSSSTARVGLSPKMKSLLFEVESICKDTDIKDFSKNHDHDEGIAVWSGDGIQKLRNAQILDHAYHYQDASSSCSEMGLLKVHPNTERRHYSTCCSVEPSCNPIPSQNKSATSSVTSSDFTMMGESSTTTTFRINQTEQWYQRYLDMVKFRETYGHCLVPLNWPTNPSLAHWVKRQRHQYRAKQERKHSTLTPERQRLLEELGFVWDSHASGWEERLKELQDFKDKHGHCRVPKTYADNPQLAIWVKCQRRQFKLYSEGKDSNMTNERIHKLKQLGFVFTPRKQKESAFAL